ncbi:MAG: hypothetical protein AVDCRST_MAG45-1286 [uncultured Solirubrobacterales bacterium]|uniref:CEMIP beta-helix domain-containing protein n=1 Tax=uncultured Solirubrobacterales bacterium TaxID=768556 RepID=A0A6J4SK29_9ACTN|nr:MAG: hypothetical protein AVDCRST_MAG45-1286 [uncultured Solirubrobacterales bacterium]
MKTRRPPADQRLLPSDSSPATFWVTNPDNVVRDNVAAGSDGHGFWLAFPEHPTGLFAATFPTENQAIWPRRTPLGEFSGNVAHSNGGDGLHVDSGPRPDGQTETSHHHARANPADTGSASVTTEFGRFAGYKNRHRAVWLRGTGHRLTGAVLADNAVGATFASHESFLQDSLLVGETANKGAPTQYETDRGRVGRDGRSLPRPWDSSFPIRGYEFYDGRVGAERTSFVNFQPYVTPSGQARQQSALGYNLTNHFSIHPRNFATALRFVNANRVHLPDLVVGYDGDASSVFLDTDGSVTGTAGRTVASNNPFLLGASCAPKAEWNAHVCDGDYATLSVGTGDGEPAAIKPLRLTRADGRIQTLMGSQSDSTRAHSSVLTNSRYGVEYNGATPQRARFVLSRGRDRWVQLNVSRAEGFRVTRYGCNVGDPAKYCYGAAASLAALASATKSSYWYDNRGDADPATGTLHLKLVSNGTDYEELKAEPPPAP